MKLFFSLSANVRQTIALKEKSHSPLSGVYTLDDDRAPIMANETNTPTVPPSSLDAWVSCLDAVQLPVPLHSHAQVYKAINDRQRSLRDIAEVMQGSPALALSLIREANQQRQSSLSEPAESLEVAISRLGLARTKALLEQLPALPVEHLPLAYRQIQLISQHAAQQAICLFGPRLARLWNEIYWGSLLFLSPLWAMALAYPKKLEEWEVRVIHQRECASRVEQALFGARLFDICRVLAEKWHLPGWVLQGLTLITEEQGTLVRALHIARDHLHPLRQQQQLDADPALRRWLNHPANCVLLANGLALSAHGAWNTPHALRWQYLTSLYLQLPFAELQQHVHQHAVSSARYHAMPDLWHPAEALLWPWDMRRIKPVSSAVPPPSAHALAEWRQHCAQLLAEPSAFTNPMHLTACARNALLACGMRRVMILMADKTGSFLRVFQVCGLPKASFDLSLNIHDSTALQRLMTQPAQVRLGPENNAMITAVLPHALRSLFPGEHLLLRSLSNKGRVVMLLLADQGGGPFSPTSVQAFGKTAQCIEKALNTFTSRGR